MKDKEVRFWVWGTVGLVLLATLLYWAYFVNMRNGIEAEIARQKAVEASGARYQAEALMRGRLERAKEPPVTNGNGY
jgi:heme exporter protein D